MTDAAMRDGKGRPLAAVTGMGMVSSLGHGVLDNWKALISGRSGVAPIARFPTAGLRTTIAATVRGRSPPEDCASLRAERYAKVAIEEAIAQASLGKPGHFPGALFAAVPPVEMEWQHRRLLGDRIDQSRPVTYAALLEAAGGARLEAWHELFTFATVADRLADRFGTQGSPISLSTACSSGATAIQLGVEAIRRGETAAALCVATDGSVNVESLVRFSLLSALSTQNDPPERAAKPFAKNRDGFVMGEGAAALVLEDARAARKRGARILGYVLGLGEKGDGFHRTRSSPDGAPIIAAIEAAIADAGLTPEDIDHVNAHGTGTPENDKMEAMGCLAVLGERMRSVPISSNKSMIGHTLTAAGAIEAVVSLMTIARGRIPPTINYHVPDPAIPLDVVANVAREARVGRVLSNSFGFGGQNACLVLAAEPA
jgi:3-oxoacyl-[acyl-carrier-protein] synthase II